MCRWLHDIGFGEFPNSHLSKFMRRATFRLSAPINEMMVGKISNSEYCCCFEILKVIKLYWRRIIIIILITIVLHFHVCTIVNFSLPCYKFWFLLFIIEIQENEILYVIIFQEIKWRLVISRTCTISPIGLQNCDWFLDLPHLQIWSLLSWKVWSVLLMRYAKKWLNWGSEIIDTL